MSDAFDGPRTSTPALLVSGLQNDFCSEDGALAKSGCDVGPIRAMLPEAARVLRAARTAGWLVVHLPERALRAGMSDSEAWHKQFVRNNWPFPLAAEGTWGERFVEGFEPAPPELVVERSRSGGLADTRATVLLRSARISRLVIIGVETHRSILATAIQAVCLDYEAVVPVQAVASTDSALGRAALEVMRSWARLVDVDELLDEVDAASAVRARAGDLVHELEG